jgi:ubiquinone/menaquinone biosynthesis C-methylase UbiE
VPAPIVGKTVVVARYDGLADWYDEQFSTWQRAVVPHLSRLLGPSDGVCLDIACGTGFLGSAVAQPGRAVVGVDISAGQLRLARARMAVVRGDAVRPPFRDATFATVMCTYLHTDIDDMGPVFAEAARTLRPRDGSSTSACIPVSRGTTPRRVRTAPGLSTPTTPTPAGIVTPRTSGPDSGGEWATDT